MNLLDKTLIIALVFVWISVFVKYESFALLPSSDNKPDDGHHHRIRESIRSAIHRVTDRKSEPHKDSSHDESRSRIRQTVREAVHKVADKIDKHKHKDDKHHNDAGGGYPAFSNDKPVKPADKSSKLDKLKDVAGAAILAKLGKKILSSGSHKKGHNKHNPENGYYDEYNYRPGRYHQVTGQICTNYLEYDGIVFGRFRCPVEGYDYDATSCCGAPREQYCCRSPSQSLNFENTNEYYERNHRYRKPKINMKALLLGIFIPLFFIVVVIAVVVAIAIYKRRGSRGGGGDAEAKTRTSDNETTPGNEAENEKLNGE